VEVLVTATDGPVLTMKYKDGEKKIVVTKDTAIVTYATSTKDELKPGAVVFINNPAKKDDGSFEAAAVTVSRDGVNPPM
jgi:hypothetical protein